MYSGCCLSVRLAADLCVLVHLSAECISVTSAECNLGLELSTVGQLFFALSVLEVSFECTPGS